MVLASERRREGVRDDDVETIDEAFRCDSMADAENLLAAIGTANRRTWERREWIPGGTTVIAAMINRVLAATRKVSRRISKRARESRGLERRDKAEHARELRLSHFIDDRVDVHQHLRGIVPALYLFGHQRSGTVVPSWLTHVVTWACVRKALLCTKLTSAAATGHERIA